MKIVTAPICMTQKSDEERSDSSVHCALMKVAAGVEHRIEEEESIVSFSTSVSRRVFSHRCKDSQATTTQPAHSTQPPTQPPTHSTQHTAHSTQHTAHSIQHTAYSTQHTAHSTHITQATTSNTPTVLYKHKQNVLHAPLHIHMHLHSSSNST
jgi:hypothetical protein